MFTNWFAAQGGPGSMGQNLFEPAVMWLVAEDAFIDVQFTAWGDALDPEFAYQRSGPPAAPPVPIPVPALALAVAAMLLVRTGVTRTAQHG